MTQAARRDPGGRQFSLRRHNCAVLPQLFFTLASGQAFWRLRVAGCTGSRTLRKLGCDPELAKRPPNEHYRYLTTGNYPC